MGLKLSLNAVALVVCHNFRVWETNLPRHQWKVHLRKTSRPQSLPPRASLIQCPPVECRVCALEDRYLARFFGPQADKMVIQIVGRIWWHKFVPSTDRQMWSMDRSLSRTHHWRTPETGGWTQWSTRTWWGYQSGQSIVLDRKRTHHWGTKARNLERNGTSKWAHSRKRSDWGFNEQDVLGFVTNPVLEIMTKPASYLELTHGSLSRGCKFFNLFLTKATFVDHVS